MARVIKEAEYNAKRNEILDYALSLVYSKGYERMTIQDLLDGLHISRGALYHYFDSKQALLEALVERIGMQGLQTLLPVVQDPDLTAIQKLRQAFEISARFKSAQKEFILSLLHVLYSEENAIIRQKMTTASLKWTASLVFEPILRQGAQEQVFTIRHPAETARVIMGIALSLSDTIIELVLTPQPDQSTVQEVEAVLDVYFGSIERILGAPEGSLRVFGVEDFKAWWRQPQPKYGEEALSQDISSFNG